MSWTRQAVASLTDEQWQDVLLRSVESPVVDGIRLPGFPPAEIQRQFNGEAGVPVVRRAYTLYQFIKQQAARLGAPIGPASRILDFGVGWGRVLRLFLKDVEAQHLYGVDVNPMILELCRSTGLPVAVAQITPRGALPHGDEFFDCVYANSVFTHLPEAVQDLWLAEIARTLRPGGVFIATVQPTRFLEYALSQAVQQSGSDWHKQLARALSRVKDPRGQLARRGFVFIPTNTPPDKPWEDATYGDAVMSPDYVRKHWAAWFRIDDHLDDQKRFEQAVVVCQRPGAR
jgi:ubiquinone/menaquinone biosynthesis C-methylase UbiE